MPEKSRHTDVADVVGRPQPDVLILFCLLELRISGILWSLFMF